MPRRGDVYENRVTGERAVVLRGEEDATAESGARHLTARPGAAVAGEHYHPTLHERFHVMSEYAAPHGHAVPEPAALRVAGLA